MSLPARSGAASRLALALAFATGLAVSAAPATAAKKDEKPAPAAKANYSKGFAAAYKPFADAMKAAGDLTPLKAQVAALQAAATTPDDKFAAGQTIYTLGAKTKDLALQRQGVELMVASNSPLAGADRPGHIYAAAQLAYQAQDWAAARSYAEQAIAAGYNGDAELLLAEAMFSQKQGAAGLDVMDKAIAKKVAAGQPVPETWLKRSLAIAYQANLVPQAGKYAGLYAQYYPSTNSWGDAIAVQRNFYDYGDQELLDLMRLAVKTNSMRNDRDYLDYVSSSDARRLPAETQRVLNAGIAAGKLRATDVFVKEASTIAGGRVSAVAADMAALARDARAANATAATVMAAADFSLSNGNTAQAEEFYKAALAKPGVDAGRALTRLGMAQLEQGRVAEAQATLAKVTGARQPIAQLWSIYAGQQAAKPAS